MWCISTFVSAGILLAVFNTGASSLIHHGHDNGTQFDCSRLKSEETFTSLASEDCYIAWKYGVSYVDEVQDFYSTLCQPDCTAALQAIEEQCGASEDMEYNMKHLSSICARNEAGRSCYKVAMLNSASMQSVYANCWDQGDGGGCRRECQSAIKEFRNDHGCCVNDIYNSSVVKFDTMLTRALSYNEEMGVAAYSLWSSCNIERPTFCSTNDRHVSVFSSAERQALLTPLVISIAICVILLQYK